MTKILANNDIREALKNTGIAQWELAERAGYSASYFCVKMRHEMSGEEKFHLLHLLQEIVDERSEANA